ncbi:MAG: hypothetical protein U0V87_14000 [Acidobacteriota bacterium]
MSPILAGSLSEKRELEPIVVKLDALASWLNLDTYKSDRLNLYRYDAASQSFTAVPFQIDKRRKINLKYNTNTSTPLIGPADVCEYGYFDVQNPPTGYASPFASDQLQFRDELVFMVADAGADRAPVTAWISGAVQNKRYELILRDLGNNELRYLYLFAFDSTATGLSTTDYVRWWNKDDPNNPCPAQALACPTNNSCGCTEGFPSGTLANRESFQLRFSKNWVNDVMRVKDTGGALLSDVLDRNQAGTIGETEDGWSDQGAPRNLGLKDGNLRVIRGIQGAMSGIHTTRYELVYATSFDSVLNLRVHELAFAFFGLDHEFGFVNDAANFTPGHVHLKTKYDAGTDLDKINASYVGSPSFQEASFFDWTQMLSVLRGSYVQLVSEPRRVAAGSRNVTYTDDSDLVGNHARRWSDIGNLQDGYLYLQNGQLKLDDDGNPIGNDGGCPVTEDPESGVYKFATVRWRYVAQASSQQPQLIGNASGPRFEDNQRLPMWVSFQEQTRNLTPLPRPAPCTPGFSVANSGAGSTNLSIGGPCSGGGFFVGYNIYRGEGAIGPLGLYRDLGAGTSMTDRWVDPGKAYRYAVQAYNDDGALGTMTAATAITVTDTTPPGKPIGIVIQPLSQGGTISWTGSFDRDLKGYDIYISNYSGGPYTKINGAVYGASQPKQWVVTGLSSSQTYYVVLKAVDLSGNSSNFSMQASFTPLP